MATDALTAVTRARSNSGSTIRADPSTEDKVLQSSNKVADPGISIHATLSTHNEALSKEHVLIAETCLTGSGLHEGDLVELQQALNTTEIRDFELRAAVKHTQSDVTQSAQSRPTRAKVSYVCIIKLFTNEEMQKLHNVEISMNKQIANQFKFTSPARVTMTKVDKQSWTSSHVEICFRDAYLSRSDMWRFASQEMVGKVVYAGQRLSFINSLKATVKNIHARGRHIQAAYFGSTTVPVFRSEAARYVIFIQMSREMWDFDSDGKGEIIFDRVVNGFLPELFKRWSNMDVRHLVSIVMFGRLEYRHSDIVDGISTALANQPPLSADKRPVDYQDFYRVVVTDMASAQWTTILEELKRDFRVFLRDVSLFKTPDSYDQHTMAEDRTKRPTKITGRLSGSLKGNILEAINLAASQFSNDYIDRDLIRTGISTVVITAGSGVFDVDRDLLKLTSETLTNNGIGIDIVCLSRMPLHSVPLFRYRLPEIKDSNSIDGMRVSVSPHSLSTTLTHASLPDLSHSPAFSATNASLKYYSRFPSAFPARLPQIYGYGIPQWIDLSYWSAETGEDRFRRRQRRAFRSRKTVPHEVFMPRVRMYELQMMGLMEIGMADMSVPYLMKKQRDESTTLRERSSHLSASESSRSLSRSPVLKRKSSSVAMKLQSRPEPSGNTQQSARSALAFMDRYDDDVFGNVVSLHREGRSSKPWSPHKSEKTRDMRTKNKSPMPQLSARLSTTSLKPKSDSDKTSDTASVVSTVPKATRPPRAPRAISYMLRGLAPMKATAATAEVSTENIVAQRVKSQSVDDPSDESHSLLTSRAGTLSKSSSLSQRPTDGKGTVSRPNTATGSDEVTRPIKINPPQGSQANAGSLSKQLWKHRRHQRTQSEQTRKDLDDSHASGSDKLSDVSGMLEPLPNSIPDSNIPFIRNVNASNPLKHRSRSGTFGRWQHLYPHKPRAATVKWRSLCTPASVPLTTEDFPSKDDLESNYNALCHVVHVRSIDDPSDDHQASMHMLFLEMISLRLAHGYQFVVGDAVSAVVQEGFADCHSIYSPDAREKPRLVVILAMGNTIQKVELVKSLSVRVTKYIQKHNESDTGMRPAVNYSSYIRTILSNDYFPRNLVLQGFSEEYPWQDADNHLAGGDEKSEKGVESLRYWRARFVLLPVEPPAATLKKHQTDASEEEIHLLGIRALTQIWQKNRYVTPHEQRIIQSRSGTSNKRDENPLEVNIETLNPSELVAMELDRLTQIEEGGENESTQLLPEPSKFDRETSVEKIAQAMQSERGIEIKNRRWHLRLHYNCFHGEEFTNWLMHNVKNLNTREDAVEFGNLLMKEGLFEHVNGRHNFKDGHYFYSIKADHRIIKPDQSKSWLGSGRTSNKSIPPTPLIEQPELSPLTVRTRSGSNTAQQHSANPSSESKPFSEKKRKAVSLSRMIRVDVDPKKRSFLQRPEVVNVHYDRFHNPENCYHLELNWLCTTCKLVDDAIILWTTAAEKFGLKLVEVPIAEAFDVPVAEPFRNPYRIKLALEPPKQKANSISFNSVFFPATSTPHPLANPPNADKHIYQKAILKRSNFVLDLEAANEFPDGVDIQYSWGQLDYKYTQFVHRSGVVLAQIMDDGDIILLANRLYNSRLVNTKEASSKMFSAKKDSGPQAHRPGVPPTATTSMQASGIVGINLASPNTNMASSPSLNPVPHLGAGISPAPKPLSAILSTSHTAPDASKPALADSFGPQSKFAATGFWNTLITPEQIKDDLKSFCQDKSRLEAFYKEVANAPPLSSISGPGSGSRRNTSSSGSSLLRPLRDIPGTAGNNVEGIPAFELPEAVTAARELRRATVAYDHVGEMFDRSRVGSRNSSGSLVHGGFDNEGNGNGHGHGRPSAVMPGGLSPLRKALK